MLEPMTTSEFMRLPEDAQLLYVAGIMGGIAFTAYSYAPSDYPAWVQCVRQKTLAATTKDVVAFLKARPRFDESVASAFARMIGERCPRH
jgi:hypothetical protein